MSEQYRILNPEEVKLHGDEYMSTLSFVSGADLWVEATATVVDMVNKTPILNAEFKFRRPIPVVKTEGQNMNQTSGSFEDHVRDLRKVEKSEAQFSGTHSSDCMCHLCHEPTVAKSATVDRQPIAPLVIADIQQRIEKGAKQYGEPLTSHNGRDALQDAYEESMDQTLYLKQALIERDSPVKESLTTDPNESSDNSRSFAEIERLKGQVDEWNGRVEKARLAINIILGNETRYKGISGTQHDGSDVDLEVCKLCGYADGHEDDCLIKIVEEKEDEEGGRILAALYNHNVKFEAMKLRAEKAEAEVEQCKNGFREWMDKTVPTDAKELASRLERAERLNQAQAEDIRKMAVDAAQRFIAAERERDEAKSALIGVGLCGRQLTKERDALRAENARLREALEKIQQDNPGTGSALTAWAALAGKGELK